MCVCDINYLTFSNIFVDASLSALLVLTCNSKLESVGWLYQISRKFDI